MSRSVLYINEVSWVGGAEGALLDLVTHLDPNEYCPVVVCPDGGEFPQLLLSRGIETHIIPFYGLRARNPLRLLQTISQLYRLVKQHNAHLIHVNQQYFSNYGVILSRICRIPVVIHLRGVESDEFYDQFARKIIAADKIIAVSEAAKWRMLEYIGLKMGKKKEEIVSKRVRVVYDGFRQPDNGLTAEELHKQFHIPAQRRVVGIVGQVTPEKGLSEFIDGAALALKGGPNLHFIVVGTDPDRGRDFDTTVKAKVRDLGIGEHFTFTGYRRDAATLISGMDVSVLASWQDAFPRVVLESLSAGVPVVATSVGGVPEMVEDGVSGLLIPPRDPAALAKALLRVLAMDSAQRLEMTAQGRQSVNRFSMESHVQQITGIYDEVLKR